MTTQQSKTSNESAIYLNNDKATKLIFGYLRQYFNGSFHHIANIIKTNEHGMHCWRIYVRFGYKQIHIKRWKWFLIGISQFGIKPTIRYKERICGICGNGNNTDNTNNIKILKMENSIIIVKYHFYIKKILIKLICYWIVKIIHYHIN